MQEEQTWLLGSQIDILTPRPSASLLTRIGPSNPEILGVFYKGRFFVHYLRIGVDVVWEELTRRYRQLCETKGIPFFDVEIKDNALCIHPFYKYGSVLTVIEELTGRDPWI